jgi:hypothetical protein
MEVISKPVLEGDRLVVANEGPIHPASAQRMADRKDLEPEAARKVCS